MKYKPLEKIFYSDKNNYETEYNNRFNSVSTIKFNFDIFENQAFLVMVPELFDNMYKIGDLNTKLTSLTDMLPPIALNQYVKRCLIEEIVLTNEIEGVISTRQDIYNALEATGYSDKHKRLFGLVKRYEKLTDNVDLNLKTCLDIRTVYNDIALQEVIENDPNDAPDGLYFRKNSVKVVSTFGKAIHAGVFPEEEINNCMTEALGILNDKNTNILLRTAIFHYLFGYIHPFYDGNGRTNRFISSYLLSRNFNKLSGYRLAYTIKEDIDSYYKAFKYSNNKKNKGDLTPFVILFFEILSDLFTKLNDSISKRLDKLSYCADMSDRLFDNEKQRQIAYVLFQNTIFGSRGMPIDLLVSASGQTRYLVDKTLKHLKSLDVLYITKDSKKPLYDFDKTKFDL